MKDFSDFKSLLDASAAGGDQQRTDRRLETGQLVDALVLEVTSEWVFVDVNAPQDGRIQRSEFGDRPPRRGDHLRVTVLDPSSEGAHLTTALGQGKGSVDVSALEFAHQGGTPVHGEIVRTVKGGLEVRVGDVSAFCPASQIELGYASDLDAYVGQSHLFKVLELRDGGRSVVLSRRMLLEDERRLRESEILSSVKPGAEVTGIVSAIQRHGALVDLGGATGFVHISELAEHRVERVEDVVQEGEQVKAQVLSLEPGDKGLRIRLSLKRLHQKKAEPPRKEQILEATVSRALNHGVLVETAQGSGLVPLKELGLPPGADHRRAFPAGKQLRVVLLSRDSKDGKLRFSATGVAGVEERRNYKEFSEQHARPGSGLGSLGDLLRDKLGLPGPPPVVEHPTPPLAPEEPGPAANAESPEPPASAESQTPPSRDRSQELGVVRRAKRDKET